MGNLKLRRRLSHSLSRSLHYYADWRIGATNAEKRCYKTSDSILLTVDDYGPADNIAAILEVLDQKRCKAMFFIQGDWAADNQALLKRIEQRGHIIGNHTYSHPDLLGLSDQAIATELAKGLPGPWFRAPRGRSNPRISQLVRSKGFYTCYWTIDSQDWKGVPVATIEHIVLSELHPGAVVLFHLHGRHTAAALPGLIDQIRTRGYEMTGFDEHWQPRAFD